MCWSHARLTSLPPLPERATAPRGLRVPRGPWSRRARQRTRTRGVRMNVREVQVALGVWGARAAGRERVYFANMQITNDEPPRSYIKIQNRPLPGRAGRGPPAAPRPRGRAPPGRVSVTHRPTSTSRPTNHNPQSDRGPREELRAARGVYIPRYTYTNEEEHAILTEHGFTG